MPLFDLGVGDVHIPRAVSGSRKGPRMATTKPKKVTAISAAKRKSLSPNQFALPEKKAYPIDTPARVRNAAARLEQAKKAGTIGDSDYRKARSAIARAAKRFGIKSEYNETARDTPPPAAPQSRLRVNVHAHPAGGHRVEIHAMSDKPVFTDAPVTIDVSPIAETATKLKAAEKALAEAPADATDEQRATLREAVTRLSDELAEPRWNHIAKVGTFKGHPAGPFELNPTVFDQIIANYRNVDQGQVPIDFEHASEADETSGSIPQGGAPAQGWVLDLQNRGPAGLWGLCKFGEPALSYIREGKYRFFSPAIRFGAKHPETGAAIGARLTSVALVNRPFLRGLTPLAARDQNAPGATKMSVKSHTENMKAFKAAMGLHDLATPKEMKDQLNRMREHAEKILDKPVASSLGHVSAGGVNCGDYMPALAEAVNAPEHMTIEEILDAVESMIDAAMEQHELLEHIAPMSDPNADPNDPAALAVRLGQATEKIRTLSAEKASLSGEKTALQRDKADLSLQLKDANAHREAAVAKVAELEGVIATMRADEQKRQEAAVVARVDEAFATYKDARNLSDEDKGDMMILARADLARFEKRYPRLLGKEYLLRDLTGSRQTGPHTMADKGGQHGSVTDPPPAQRQPNASALSADDMVLLADKLKAKGYSNETATSEAYAIATGKKPMPAGITLN